MGMFIEVDCELSPVCQIYVFWDIQDMLIDISHYGCDLENIGSME